MKYSARITALIWDDQVVRVAMPSLLALECWFIGIQMIGGQVWKSVLTCAGLLSRFPSRRSAAINGLGFVDSVRELKAILQSYIVIKRQMLS